MFPMIMKDIPTKFEALILSPYSNRSRRKPYIKEPVKAIQASILPTLCHRWATSKWKKPLG